MLNFVYFRTWNQKGFGNRFRFARYRGDRHAFFFASLPSIGEARQLKMLRTQDKSKSTGLKIGKKKNVRVNIRYIWDNKLNFPDSLFHNKLEFINDHVTTQHLNVYILDLSLIYFIFEIAWDKLYKLTTFLSQVCQISTFYTVSRIYQWHFSMSWELVFWCSVWAAQID